MISESCYIQNGPTSLQRKLLMVQWTQAVSSILMRSCLGGGVFGSGQPAHYTHRPLPFSLTF